MHACIGGEKLQFWGIFDGKLAWEGFIWKEDKQELANDNLCKQLRINSCNDAFPSSFEGMSVKLGWTYTYIFLEKEYVWDTY